MKLKSFLPHGLVCRYQAYRDKIRKRSPNPKIVKKFSDPSLSEKEKTWLWNHGFYPLHKRLYGLNIQNIHKYIDRHSYRKLHPLNGKYSQLIDSKEFLPIVSNEGPEIHVVLVDGVVRYADGVARPTAIDTLREYLSEGNTLACRPSGKSGGDGFRILNQNNIDGNLASNISRGTWIITSTIRNSAFAQEIFLNSLNTIRLLFVRDFDDDKLFLAAASHRFGTEASRPVDNAGRGGVMCPVNLKTGKIIQAVRYKPRLERFDRHPDTNEDIVGESIPGWSKVVPTIVDDMNTHDWLDYCGVDVVLYENEYVVIEINSLPDLALHQIESPLLVDPRVRTFFEVKGMTL
jgi:hypothetical protein